MATIYKDFIVDASPDFVWEAIKDVGAVHNRLAQGFVTNTELSGDIRMVTFSNGFIVREQIITISDELWRLSYTAIGGISSHHNAYFQIFGTSEEKTQVLWVTDFLPAEIQDSISQMVDAGSVAIQQTLERKFRGV
ncbi:MAG: SRPBCC family protein [Sulfuricurvum sp.]|nr:SRPBCC family protein [Sulfuricurvum sp.]